MPYRYLLRTGLAALLAVLLAAPTALAQTSFSVTVQDKTDDHPYADMGRDEAYWIDNVEANELTLTRGETYTFVMDDVPSNHPFYISTSDVGGGEGVYSEGVTGNFATGTETLTFTVPDDAPDELWYQCQFHQFMGWRLNITGSSSTEDDAEREAFALAVAGANPFRDGTALQLTLPEAADVTVAVFDAAGRRVATLLDGALPAGSRMVTFGGAALAAGVYAVRATAAGETVEARVTLVR